MTYKEMRELSGMTQQRFSDFFGIPKRTIEDWDSGKSSCKQYLVDLLAYRLTHPNEDFERCYYSLKDLRLASGMTQKELSEYFNLDLGSVKNWESVRSCPDRVLCLIEYRLFNEKLIN